MTITRVGTNQKYADGWEKAFSGKKGGSAASKTQKKAAPSKKAAGKKVAKKGKR